MKVVSDWRDISSHYILAKQASGKNSLFGFQRNTIQNLDASVELKDGDELIRCVTPNEAEDFLLINNKEKIIRTYTNTASRNSDQMIVTKYRKIKIIDIEQKVGVTARTNSEKLSCDFHTAVGSKENDYLMFFNRFDVVRCKIDL